MIKSLFQLGAKSGMTAREKRVIRLINLMAVAMGSAILCALSFNLIQQEYTNSLLLILFSLLFFSVLIWNKHGQFLVSKIILGFAITVIPFLNLALSGRIPDGQYISVIPACLTSFCVFLLITDRYNERWLHFIGVSYYLLYALFIDSAIVYLSKTTPDLSFINDNYYYYKVPFVICMIFLLIAFRFFKGIIYAYERQAELVQEDLESKVAERTSELLQSNRKLIDFAFITAHEIRGPLSSIMTVTDYFTSNPQDHSIESMLPQLHERSNKMDKAIIKMVKKLEGDVEVNKTGIFHA